MAYDTDVSAPGLIAQKNGTNGRAVWSYVSADSIALVGVADYFSNGDDLGMKVGDQVIVTDSDTGGTVVTTVSAVTSGGAASVSGGTQDAPDAGAVVITPGIQVVTLTNATQITATIAEAALHAGIFSVKQAGTGTAGHTVTLTSGTWDGTNNTATLNAQNEQLVVLFDNGGNGTIIVNTGAVALSSV
jgi:hypothetical protein